MTSNNTAEKMLLQVESEENEFLLRKEINDYWKYVSAIDKTDGLLSKSQETCIQRRQLEDGPYKWSGRMAQ